VQEIWVDVKGYEGAYQVSNLGNVRSLEREVKQGIYGHTRCVGGSLMKPRDNGHGYLIIPLSKEQKRKNFYIHRLVAEHFVENVCGLKYVNHKDFDPHNNRSDNLEWCTQRENIQYSVHRMRKPHKQWKVPATGEKYIYFRDGRFRLSIRNVVDKTYSTLAEAVEAREVILRGEKYSSG
jgi:hypothetical protein